MLCWCRHPTPKASSRSRSAWKLAGKLPFFLVLLLVPVVQRFHDPPVPHSVTNLPWKRRCFEVLFLGQGIRWFSRRFQRGGQTAVQPQISEKEIQLWRLLLVESMEEDEWKLHETRGKKNIKSLGKYYGKSVEILWTYSSYHNILSYLIHLLYLILSSHAEFTWNAANGGRKMGSGAINIRGIHIGPFLHRFLHLQNEAMSAISNFSISLDWVLRWVECFQHQLLLPWQCHHGMRLASAPCIHLE